LWTLPNHLTEWEVRKLKHLNRRVTPEAVQRWSEPLPEAQWAKPSEELKRLSDKVRQKQRTRPWNQRACKLTPQLGRISMEEYRRQRPAGAWPI